MRYFAVLLLGLVALAGCGPDTETQKGAPGEICFRDTDCRDDLICEQRICVPISDADNNGEANNGDENNGDTNNGVINNGDPFNNGDVNNDDPFNNGDDNNGESNRRRICTELCAYVTRCFGDDLPIIECVDSCEQELPGDEDDLEDFAECVFDLTCEELEREIERCL